MVAFEKAEAVLAVIGAGVMILGAIWTVLRLVARGQDAPKEAIAARQRTQEESLAAERHAQVVTRLEAVEREIEELKQARQKTDDRLGDVERTMATRDDIKELAQKLEVAKRDIVSDIAALLGVGRSR